MSRVWSPPRIESTTYAESLRYYYYACSQNRFKNPLLCLGKKESYWLWNLINFHGKEN
jgi:hypothetical protein